MARKSDPEIVAALQAVTDYDQAVIEDLAAVGNRVNIPDHWSIMFEKTSADMAYILLEGQVEVRKDGQAIATLDPGEIFGEMALIQHTLRSASVVAITPISALRLDHESLAKLFQDHPEWAEQLRGRVEQYD
ncbi:MAG TPA: cyclic nucleotide-binding domain-containing protein [Aeromicrobium sp.]|nr:cyclic nucleotide-binding domain-containing protein [Aeromicrobium sp.]